MLPPIDPQRRWLLLVAAPKECHAVISALAPTTPSQPDLLPFWTPVALAPRFELVRSGVGKSNAAAALARTFDPARHAGAISLGIAGALPHSGLTIGDVVDADRATFADEGSENPDGFLSIARMGFGPLESICGRGSGLDDMAVNATPVFATASLGALTIRHGGVATVSTCSGTDRAALAVRDRTGAIAEDMEAAAVGAVLLRLAPAGRFSALKVISNTTGDRAAQSWDIRRALSVLSTLAAAM